MSSLNRSLAACLRCRRQKLKCGGPDRVPCQRCRTSGAECVFVAPRAAQPARDQEMPHTQAGTNEDKLARLDQRLNSVEKQLRREIQELQKKVADITTTTPASVICVPRTVPPAESLLNVSTDTDFGSLDIVARGVLSEDDWKELYSFYHHNCETVISVMDDQIYPPVTALRQHPLMSTVICCIAARAIKPEIYESLVAEADSLIKDTFYGPTPDLLTLAAMMLLTAWTGRTRLWGYIASIAVEMKLNIAALQLGDDSTEKTESLVERARIWFTVCCFDLQMNLTRSYIINGMRDYFPHSEKLLTSPYRHAVDYRICAYIRGFTITGDAKSKLQSSEMQIQPLPLSVAESLTAFDQRVDMWFHDLNNSIDPLFQTFSEKQDRNRFMMTYAFMKLYVNGLALNGVTSGNDLDPVRLHFIQTALDNACLTIQTQYESQAYRQALRYTMDYNGITAYHALSYIRKAINILHEHIDCGKLLVALRQAAQIFEQAGALEAAAEMRREQEKLAALTKIVLSPEATVDKPFADMQNESLFDIPNFLVDMAWDDEFPAISMYAMD